MNLTGIAEMKKTRDEMLIETKAAASVVTNAKLGMVIAGRTGHQSEEVTGDEGLTVTGRGSEAAVTGEEVSVDISVDIPVEIDMIMAEITIITMVLVTVRGNPYSLGWVFQAKPAAR